MFPCKGNLDDQGCQNTGNSPGDDHLSKTGELYANLWSQVVFPGCDAEADMVLPLLKEPSWGEGTYSL